MADFSIAYIPPRGQVVPDATCPACGADLRYHAGRRLACARCPWAVVLTPAEHLDLAWYLTAPGMLDTPVQTFIAHVARRVALVPPPPDQQLVGVTDGEGYKWRVTPAGEETPVERLERLSEQAEINGVQVVPLNDLWTEFRVSSQRRDADGNPVAWYAVRISAWEARCSCPAQGVCAHLAASHALLQEEHRRHGAHPAPEYADVAGNSALTVAKAPAAGIAATQAYHDLWG